MLSKLRELGLQQLFQHKKRSMNAFKILVIIQELVLVHQAGQDPISLLYNFQSLKYSMYLVITVEHKKSTDIIQPLAISHVSLRCRQSLEDTSQRLLSVTITLGEKSMIREGPVDVLSDIFLIWNVCFFQKVLGLGTEWRATSKMSSLLALRFSTMASIGHTLPRKDSGIPFLIRSLTKGWRAGSKVYAFCLSSRWVTPSLASFCATSRLWHCLFLFSQQ